jgi:hypothetical protein
LPFIGKRAARPVAALPLLAALTPPGHRLTIVDENVEPIDFERCAKADIVGVAGMVEQCSRMREILTELRRRGAFTVVGGPWASVSENYFDNLADVVFVGDAEETGRASSWIGRKGVSAIDTSRPTRPTWGACRCRVSIS